MEAEGRSTALAGKPAKGKGRKMMGNPEAQVSATRRRSAAALLAVLALAGCNRGEAIQSVTSADEGAPAQAGSGPADLEAPEIFRVTEPGLWDGRPSLGGTWVAHPDVSAPERVRIVNQSNGQSIIGALFRRERDLPGPALQVSSDAAEALGMLAGAPATLDVVALRRTEPPALPEEAAQPPADDGAPPAAIAEDEVETSLSGTSAVSTLRSPFVQVGSYDVEVFAQDTAENLAAKGLPVSLVQVPGQEAWRLLLGPATTEAEQSELLDQAMAEGFDDAYLVRR